MFGSSSPVCAILPSFILERLASSNALPGHRRAMNSLLGSERVRGHRDAMADLKTLLAVPTGGKRRSVYDVRDHSQHGGRLARVEGAPPVGDPAVDEAYDGAGDFYDFLNRAFSRDSLDNHGLPLDASVHYGQSFDNAFWDGKQMLYGDGDEDLPEEKRVFNRFTLSIDVIGHELTHGLIENEARLFYFGQHGALNESFADVMGSLLKQWKLQQRADEADWIIGDKVFTSRISARGVRSLASPGSAFDDPLLGRDPQVGHMKDFRKLATSEDHGGVHCNSGIPNRAFYLAALEIGGFAWEGAGRIWYTTLCERLQRNAQFTDAARQTYQVAGEIFGQGSREQVAVKNGWETVGVSGAGGIAAGSLR